MMKRSLLLVTLILATGIVACSSGDVDEKSEGEEMSTASTTVENKNEEETTAERVQEYMTMIFVVSAKGKKAMHRYKNGSVRTTVSTRLRSSNRPMTRPASVKFAGI